jgi:NuA3 HAT complex component NTO1
LYYPITVTDLDCRLDEKTRNFRSGFELLAERLRERYYTSVSDFSRDISRVFSQALGEDTDESAEPDMNAIHSRLQQAQPGTAEHMALSHEQKELKKLAKRIVKAVKEPLEDATRKEAELRGREMHEELRKLDSMGMFASTAKAHHADGDEDAENDSPVKRCSGSDASAAAGASPEIEADGDVDMRDADENMDKDAIRLKFASKDDDKEDTIVTHNSKHTPASYASSTSDQAPKKPAEPLSPPTSRSSSDPSGAAAPGNGESGNNTTGPHDVFADGGVPWYLKPFDPVGTTIHEERYTGRAVLREMSEELSDMDEDTLTELATGAENTPNEKPTSAIGSVSVSLSSTASIQKKASKKKKGRRSQWSR